MPARRERVPGAIPRSPDVPASPERAGEARAGLDVEDSTREELYERAKRLGIEGRSKMSKDELARAIERARR